MSRVRFTDPNGREKVVNIADFGGHITIGRTPDCAVNANSLSVSRNHARIWEDNGGYHILDLNSSNGTFVNGRRVESQLLAPNDLIKCGEFTLVFEDDSIPAGNSLDAIPIDPGDPNLEPIPEDMIDGGWPQEEPLPRDDGELDRLRAMYTESEEKLSQAYNRIATLENDLAQSQAQYNDDLAATRSSLEREIEEGRVQVSSLGMQLRDLSTQNQDLSSRLRQREEELETLRRAPPAPPVSADGPTLEELTLRQELLQAKEELFRLRRSFLKS